ncbi:hypothetical protein OJ253_1579 [Cryptosporidium canis]|uniref:Uncharacterized protein n=1 Tax=Cryptosporidium canis TaxID=195482 RepID=A0A9D5DL10_9CRYT|nr:hypothetical protein OJ253_1579 [Cryptosporidium canis]
MNKPISSDNLKDAVRKWHAKRKKDPNNQAGIESTLSESEVILGAKKHDAKQISTWNNNTPVEVCHASQFSIEQKRPRSTEIDGNIKCIFDGPLSFDTIMELKRKKSNVVPNNDKTPKYSQEVVEQSFSNDHFIGDFTQASNSIMEDYREKIDLIHSRSMGYVQNFSNCNSVSEVIRVFEFVISNLSDSIQEMINTSSVNADGGSYERSLDICIDFILNKSNSIDDKFDENSLEFLAKYPVTFESLKTLTKIQGLDTTMPYDINNHIIKLCSQINKVYNSLNS